MVVREMSNLSWPFGPQIPIPWMTARGGAPTVLNTYTSEDKPISEIT